MPYLVAAKNLMLNQIKSAIKVVSLHDGQPSPENELRGAPYARAAVHFAEPLNGEMKLKERPVIPVPEGARITHAGFWSSAGRLLATAPVDPVEFERSGVYVIDSAIFDLNRE